MFKQNSNTPNGGTDINLLLANERTLLAWVRTSLTLIGGGLAAGFIYDNRLYGLIIGIGAVGFGGMLAIVGYIRYLAADKAIREGHLPSTGASGLIVVLGVAVFALALLFFYRLG